MVDARKYSAGFIMPDDLRDGSRQERIIHVYISEKHDVPVLEFESGDQLLAWPSVARVLVRALGFETDGWVGHLVELALGSYTTKDGETKDTVLLRVISSRDGGSNNGGPQRIDPAKLPPPAPKRGLAGEPDDEIPP